jgi:predicted dinucleotide-binding enzyme
MKISILGTGRAARALSGKWSQAGHEITLGSRDPSTATGTVYPVLTSSQAVEIGEVVVNAAPGAATIELVKQIGPENFAGRVVLDAANAVTPDLRLLYPDDSLGERLQQLLPAADVVKTLNTLNTSVMTAPDAVASSSVFLSGDDEQAKQTVLGLLKDLGWPADSVVDLGGITTARGPEHYFIMFATVLQAIGSPLFNIRVVD